MANQPHRYNFWGYSTVAYFAPMARYSQASAQGRPGQAVIDEFKAMVRECHRRGMEVWMDVVFNHTAEGNQQGPCLSFRCGQLHLHMTLCAVAVYFCPEAQAVCWSMACAIWLEMPG